MIAWWWLLVAFLAGAILAHRIFRYGMRMAGRKTDVAQDIVQDLSTNALVTFRNAIDAEIDRRKRAIDAMERR